MNFLGNFQEAKKNFEKLVTDPKSVPKTNPKNEALANILIFHVYRVSFIYIDIRDAVNVLDRLGTVAAVPNKDPKKIVDATKALNKKIDPIIKAVCSFAFALSRNKLGF